MYYFVVVQGELGVFKERKDVQKKARRVSVSSDNGNIQECESSCCLLCSLDVTWTKSL